jgi:hypothetical protein
MRDSDCGVQRAMCSIPGGRHIGTRICWIQISYSDLLDHPSGYPLAPLLWICCYLLQVSVITICFESLPCCSIPVCSIPISPSTFCWFGSGPLHQSSFLLMLPLVLLQLMLAHSRHLIRPADRDNKLHCVYILIDGSEIFNNIAPGTNAASRHLLLSL